MSDSTLGNTIIDRVDIGIPSDNTELVFVKKNYDDCQPYVIWKRFKGDSEQRAYTYSGHYFGDFLAAVVKWMELVPQDRGDFEIWKDENGNYHTDIDGSIA